MELKILDEEHFILSAKAEVMGSHWLIYTPYSDAVVVNEDAPEVGENFVKLMFLYMESTDWGRKEVRELTKNEHLLSFFSVLDEIIRTRKKLNRRKRKMK